MTTDNRDKAKTDLLRELENLRAQLDDPDSAMLSEDDIPILLDKVEKAVADTPDLDSLAEEGLEPEEIEALRDAYREATQELQQSETRLLQKAVETLQQERQAIEAVTGDAWQQKSAPRVLPGQQSLFDLPEGVSEPNAEGDTGLTPDTAKSSGKPAPERPKALGENPFLPRHIRERLQERRQALENDIAQAASFFPQKNAQTPPPAAGTTGPAFTPLNPVNADAQQLDHQDLVEALVAEYLPRLEAELRARLKTRLQELAQDSH